MRAKILSKAPDEAEKPKKISRGKPIVIPPTGAATPKSKYTPKPESQSLIFL